MNRRAFLETVTAAGAGLIVGAEALDVWDRLTWRRKYWAGVDVMRAEISYTLELTRPDGTHQLYTGVRPIYTTAEGFDVIEVPLDGVEYRPQVFAKNGKYHWAATPIAPRA